MIVVVIIKMHKLFPDFIRRRHKIFVDPTMDGTYIVELNNLNSCYFHSIMSLKKLTREGAEKNERYTLR